MSEFVPAKFNPLRVFTPNGKAITVDGRNRYTGQIVNANGLTRETFELQQAFLAAFPDSPTKVNFAVDRNQRGTSNLSDHARGEALDIMVSKYDGKPGVSAEDREWGKRAFQWFIDQMHADGGAKVRGLRGKVGMGPYRIVYPLFDHETAQASEGGVRRLMRGSGDPHVDHIHVSVLPRAVGDALPPKNPEPRRNLWLKFPKMKGPDVELVQKVTGAKIYPPGVGVFGPATDAAVRRFQFEHGLLDDGKVGPKTWAVIDEVSKP